MDYVLHCFVKFHVSLDRITNIESISLMGLLWYCRHATDGSWDWAGSVRSCLLLRLMGRLLSLCHQVSCPPWWQALEWPGPRVLLHKVRLHWSQEKNLSIAVTFVHFWLRYSLFQFHAGQLYIWAVEIKVCSKQYLFICICIIFTNKYFSKSNFDILTMNFNSNVWELK